MDVRKVAVHHPSHRDKQMVWDLQMPSANQAKILYMLFSVVKADANEDALDDAIVDIDLVRWGFKEGLSSTDKCLTPAQTARIALLQGETPVRNDVISHLVC